MRPIKMYLEKHPRKDSHPFTGVYHPHPMFAPSNMSGLVSTISQDPPLLRWVFVDSKTFEVRYGGKAESEGHIVGPWDWTDDENNVTLEGWEGFLAIWVPHEKAWKLYFDKNDDGCGLPRGTKGVEISLRYVPRLSFPFSFSVLPLPFDHVGIMTLISLGW
jgi:hypothetical protein